MTKSLQEQYRATPLSGTNAALIEDLYELYLSDPDAVGDQWRQYFSGIANGSGASETAHSPIVDRLREIGKMPAAARPRAGNGAAAPVIAGSSDEKQAAVSRLIQVYALRGHQIADIDPLGLMERPAPRVLDFDFLGLEPSDMDTEFFTGGLAGTGHERMRLRDILALLRQIYCGKTGAEFAHISRSRERLWLREQFESRITRPIPPDEQRWLLKQLSRAE
ncbi:MAG: 2-oxoglutarate dehydrogenase E1 component, partial [Pseudomonadota bacterium]